MCTSRYSRHRPLSGWSCYAGSSGSPEARASIRTRSLSVGSRRLPASPTSRLNLPRPNRAQQVKCLGLRIARRCRQIVAHDRFPVLPWLQESRNLVPCSAPSRTRASRSVLSDGRRLYRMYIRRLRCHPPTGIRRLLRTTGRPRSDSPVGGVKAKHVENCHRRVYGRQVRPVRIETDGSRRFQGCQFVGCFPTHMDLDRHRRLRCGTQMDLPGIDRMLSDGRHLPLPDFAFEHRCEGLGIQGRVPRRRGFRTNAGVRPSVVRRAPAMLATARPPRRSGSTSIDDAKAARSMPSAAATTTVGHPHYAEVQFVQDEHRRTQRSPVHGQSPEHICVRLGSAPVNENVGVKEVSHSGCTNALPVEPSRQLRTSSGVKSGQAKSMSDLQRLMAYQQSSFAAPCPCPS